MIHGLTTECTKGRIGEQHKRCNYQLIVGIILCHDLQAATFGLTACSHTFHTHWLIKDRLVGWKSLIWWMDSLMSRWLNDTWSNAMGINPILGVTSPWLGMVANTGGTRKSGVGTSTSVMGWCPMVVKLCAQFGCEKNSSSKHITR